MARARTAMARARARATARTWVTSWAAILGHSDGYLFHRAFANKVLTNIQQENTKIQHETTNIPQENKNIPQETPIHLY
eukprot:9911285-Heterocapsa_arctica.AAC.1